MLWYWQHCRIFYLQSHWTEGEKYDNTANTTALVKAASHY